MELIDVEIHTASMSTSLNNEKDQGENKCLQNNIDSPYLSYQAQENKFSEVSPNSKAIKSVNQRTHITNKSNQVLDAFLCLVDNKSFSDVLIRVKGAEAISAHKNILLVRCPKMLVMVSGEIGHSVIDLSEFTRESVLSVLEFIYGGKLYLQYSSFIRQEILYLAEKFELRMQEPHLSDSFDQEDSLPLAFLTEEKKPVVEDILKKRQLLTPTNQKITILGDGVIKLPSRMIGNSQNTTFSKTGETQNAPSSSSEEFPHKNFQHLLYQFDKETLYYSVNQAPAINDSEVCKVQVLPDNNNDVQSDLNNKVIQDSDNNQGSCYIEEDSNNRTSDFLDGDIISPEKDTKRPISEKESLESTKLQQVSSHFKQESDCKNLDDSHGQNVDNTNGVDFKSKQAAITSIEHPDSVIVAEIDMKHEIDKTVENFEIRFPQEGNPNTKLKYICPICGKACGKATYLRDHLALHEGKKNHVCTLCKKAYTWERNLIAHLKRHNGQKNYLCQICGKSFINQWDFKKHENIHSENSHERKHACSLCPKSFKSISSLNVHLLTHSGEKKYKCIVCGKAFFHAYKLKSHQEIHSKREKNHLCDECGKSFFAAKELESHYVIHSRKKKHVCTFCGEAFLHSCQLIDHKATHLANTKTPYKCTVCGKTYKFNSSFYRHNKLKHSKLPK